MLETRFSHCDVIYVYSKKFTLKNFFYNIKFLLKLKNNKFSRKFNLALYEYNKLYAEKQINPYPYNCKNLSSYLSFYLLSFDDWQHTHVGSKIKLFIDIIKDKEKNNKNLRKKKKLQALKNKQERIANKLEKEKIKEIIKKNKIFWKKAEKKYKRILEKTYF